MHRGLGSRDDDETTEQEEKEDWDPSSPSPGRGAPPALEEGAADNDDTSDAKSNGMEESVTPDAVDSGGEYVVAIAVMSLNGSGIENGSAGAGSFPQSPLPPPPSPPKSKRAKPQPVASAVASSLSLPPVPMNSG